MIRGRGAMDDRTDWPRWPSRRPTCLPSHLAIAHNETEGTPCRWRDHESLSSGEAAANGGGPNSTPRPSLVFASRHMELIQTSAGSQREATSPQLDGSARRLVARPARREDRGCSSHCRERKPAESSSSDGWNTFAISGTDRTIPWASRSRLLRRFPDGLHVRQVVHGRPWAGAHDQPGRFTDASKGGSARSSATRLMRAVRCLQGASC